MKKIVKVFGWFVAIVLIAVLAAFYFTAELPKTADKFFTAVKEKNMDQAYSLVSDAFKEETSQQELHDFLQDNGFDAYQVASWNSRNVSNNTGKLVGLIKTTDGKELPLSMDFIKSQGEWKIHAIEKPDSGIQAARQTAEMPPEKDLINLVGKTMTDFAHSINQKDMGLLREESSSLFKKQVSLEKFNQAYQSFFKFEDKLLILDQLSPQFTHEALINKDGVLIIQGQYPTTPNPLVFTSKYIYEGYGWKLLGLNVQIK